MSKLDIQKLVEILDNIRYPLKLMTVSDCVHWHYDNQRLYWSDGIFLLSDELIGGYTRQDGYFITNIGGGIINGMTTIFSEANELSYDDFMNKYEDLV